MEPGEVEEILGRTGVVFLRWRAEEGWPIDPATPTLAAFGYSAQELASGTLSYTRLIHPEDRRRIEVELDELAGSGGDLAVQELRIVCSTGEVRWVEQRVGPRRDAAGRLTHFDGVLIDVTAGRATAAGERVALRESEALYRRIVDTAIEGMWMLAPDATTTFVNARLADMLGYRREEMLGRPSADFLFREDVGEHLVRMEARRRGVRETYERRLRRKDGQAIWVLVSATPLLDDQQRFAGSFAMLTDVTERKRAEDALRQSEERYRQLTELSPDAIAVHSGGRVLFVNPACVEMVGARSREDWLGQPLLRWVHPDSHAVVRERVRLMLEEGKRVPLLEEKFLRVDGTAFDVEVAAAPIVYEGLPAVQVIFRDITARKAAEQERERLLAEVQAERRRLRVILDTAPVGISLHLPPDGRPALFNRAAEAILGRPPFHDVRLPTGEPFPPESLPVNRSMAGETLTGVEMLVRLPSGRDVSILANSAPVHGAEGRVTGVVVSFQDISPLKEQERLRDEFIAAAAHELKTPVTTIKGYAELLRRWSLEQREAHAAVAIEQINANANRIGRRVQEMLEVVRHRRAQAVLLPARLDLGDLAARVLERVRPLNTRSRMSLRRDQPAVVEADRERLEGVLVALLDNAIAGSPQGGDIEVRVGTRAREALVSVHDDGVGIPRERQPHVFDPFYEAVSPGAPGYRGIVALSLYLAKLTIELHRGRIWLESEEGKGSTFFFSLPLANEGGDASSP